MSAHYEAVVRCEAVGCDVVERFAPADVYASRTPGSTVVIFDDRDAGTTFPTYCAAHTPTGPTPGDACTSCAADVNDCGPVAACCGSCSHETGYPDLEPGELAAIEAEDAARAARIAS